VSVAGRRAADTLGLTWVTREIIVVGKRLICRSEQGGPGGFDFHQPQHLPARMRWRQPFPVRASRATTAAVSSRVGRGVERGSPRARHGNLVVCLEPLQGRPGSGPRECQ